MNLPGLLWLTTKTKLLVISALVRQRLVPSFCLPSVFLCFWFCAYYPGSLRWKDEDDGDARGSSFLLFAGGNQEDDDVNVGILSLLLAFISVYCFLCLYFLGFFFPAPPSLARSPLPSFYKASGNLGGGNGRPPKCSVTDAFNEETHTLAANGRNVSAINGGAVAEEEDGE